MVLTSPAFAVQVCGVAHLSKTLSPLTQLRKTQFSIPPPVSFARPSYSSQSVTAWLSHNLAEDSAIIRAARACGLPIVRVYEDDAIIVSQIARATRSRIIYLSAKRYPSCLSLFQVHNLIPIPVQVFGTPSGNSPSCSPSPLISLNVSVAVGAVGSVAPLLYEKKGDTVTKFYGSDEERSSKEKRLHPRKEVDERSVWDKVIAWLVRVYLPRGFPHTTTPDYISFTKYRTLQNLASAIMSVIR